MRSLYIPSGTEQSESSKLTLLLMLCAAWLLPGLVGHAPWKPDEGVSMGIVQYMLNTGEWRVPMLGGEPYLAHGPLYYWTAAVFAKGFSWALATHDAARLASGFYLVLTLAAIGFAARELFGATMPRLAIALLISCVGLLAHAHEMITDTALLAGYAMVFAGFSVVERNTKVAGTLLGVGIGVAFLARGIVPLAVVLCVGVLLTASPVWRTRRYARSVGIGLLVSLPFLAIWPMLLHAQSPAWFNVWWHGENEGRVARFVTTYAKNEFAYFFRALPWFAWPVLPIALWTVWGYRRKLLREARFQVPLLFFLVMLVFVGLNAATRDIYALPMLLPLTLLAVPGAENLRRGAANALGWFGIMFFGAAALFMWFAWSATLTGVPERFSRHILKLQPGFTPGFEWFAFVVAVLLTLLWLLPLRQSFRSGRRAVFHWAAGITLVWGLAATLWLPWIDAGKRYTTVIAKLQRQLPKETRCIASRNLGEAQRGLLYYHAGIVTQRLEVHPDAASECDWLLTQVNPRRNHARAERGWVKVWQGGRPGDKSEAFVLYRREARAR